MRNRQLYTRVLAGMPTALFLLLMGCDSSRQASIQHDINAIAALWVPDQREGVCNVVVTKGRDGTLILDGETLGGEVRTEMLGLASKYGTTLIDSIRVLPDSSGGNGGWGLVTLSVANIRKQPEHEAEMVSQAILGTPVRVLKIKNGWMWIQTPDNYLGWTEIESIAGMDANALLKWQRSARIIYIQNTGWINTVSGDEVVSDIVAGSVVETTAKTPDYYEIVLPDGRTGRLPQMQVRDFSSWKAAIQPSGHDICQTAVSLAGIPYLWGGASPKSADCSGFVQSVYFRHGIVLRRDASLQLKQGQDIAISGWNNTLQEGDLLFFGTNKESLQATHVAIYLGDTEFIHASGRVKVNSLDSTRSNFDAGRRKTLIAARRISGQGDQTVVKIAGHPWY